MIRAASALWLAVAAALIAPAAKAQCMSGYCESYGYSNYGWVYGYSRTFGYYGDVEQVQSTLRDPGFAVLDSTWRKANMTL